MYDYTTYYCGPNYSDGKVQPSVANGDMVPTSPIDFLCMQHDRAYALSRDMPILKRGAYLQEADNKFYNEATYASTGVKGLVYGSLVKYLNKHMPSLRGTVDIDNNDYQVIYNPNGQGDPYQVRLQKAQGSGNTFGGNSGSYQSDQCIESVDCGSNGNGFPATRRNASIDPDSMVLAEYRNWHKENRPPRPPKPVYFDEKLVNRSNKSKKKRKTIKPPKTKTLFQQFEQWLRQRKTLPGN